MSCTVFIPLSFSLLYQFPKTQPFLFFLSYSYIFLMNCVHPQLLFSYYSNFWGLLFIPSPFCLLFYSSPAPFCSCSYFSWLDIPTVFSDGLHSSPAPFCYYSYFSWLDIPISDGLHSSAAPFLTRRIELSFFHASSLYSSYPDYD
jgi:hypothetical protein